MSHFDPQKADSFGYAWHSSIDRGKFFAWVEQKGDGYTGTLRVERTEDAHLLLEQEVGVSYAARFGPDIGDVYLWQDIAIKVIDDSLGVAD